MNIVISYTRQDRPRVDGLVAGLRSLGHQPWYDRSLHSGENWWNEILRRIVTADAVLLAISPAFLSSHACTAERRFAVAVRRPLLAVMVSPVGHAVLPVELANLHILDYVHPTETSAFDLVRSIAALPPAPPPPHPPPPAPPVPLSYLNTLRDQISGPPPHLNSRLAVVAKLTDGMRSGDPDESRGARELLVAFAQRGQLYEQPAQLIRAALGEVPLDPVPPWNRPRETAGPPIPSPHWPPTPPSGPVSPSAPRTSRRRGLIALAVGGIAVLLIVVLVNVVGRPQGIGGPTTIAVGDVVSYTPPDLPAGSTCQWSLSDGTGSFGCVSQPVIVTEPGPYTLLLLYRTPDGKNGSLSLTIDAR